MKIIIKPTGGYAEETQPNPMRWLMLYRQPDGSFHSHGAWIKCKDFFNDYAYTKQTGNAFQIYGFKPNEMKVAPKDQPEYMLLDNITKSWPYNMKVMNDWLLDQGMPVVPFTEHEGQWLIQLDPVYWHNTYFISLISLIIRLMNTDKEFKTFAEAISWKNFPQRDQGKWDPVVKAGFFFKIPKKYWKYMWFCGPERNSDNTPHTHYGISNLVHNCGVLEWTKWITNADQNACA
jgi:hypothetical protein